ncbi:NUDIX domain-containing protein [Deinococcus malanensis]|uniref:NUDIX domain-containing protein n=1 Tax=Deinococcus malanensis TaxID=1706855 RepID=UPI00362C49F8
MRARRAPAGAPYCWGQFLVPARGAAGSNEDTAAAAAREWTEETGVSAGPLRLVGVVENFFGPNEAREHEVGFYYRMDAPPQLPEASFALTDNPRVRAEWLPLDKIHIRPVYPRAACALLALPPGEVRHLVHRE